jgi:hypothetical protein
VDEANRVLTEAPERFKDLHRACYRCTQAGESIAYGSDGELRIGGYDLRVFVTSSKGQPSLGGELGSNGQALASRQGPREF